MKPTVEQIGELLALGRDARPEADYWQGFLREFHQRQREDAVKSPGISGIFGRATAWFADIGPTKWGYGAGLAYAAITLAFILAPSQVVKEGVQGVPVNYQVAPALTLPPVQQLNQLDLSPLTHGMTGEQVF
ncbi:MAG: hypothetical protein V4640_00300 [Verrucomicrobiota bacterium]